MNSFAQLHFDLLTIPSRKQRVHRLYRYMQDIQIDADRHWAESLLRNTGKRRYIKYDELRICVSDFTELPLWLIEECIQHTGNLTDATTLLVKSNTSASTLPLHEIMDRLHDLNHSSYKHTRDYIHSLWRVLSPKELYVFNRIITGTYRSPVSETELNESFHTKFTATRRHATIKAVLLYVSRNEYTFAVWKDELLVPIVKAKSGIVSDEHLRIRDYVSKNTREQFGPVVSINPGLVYEIAFESVERANRRKSGVKLISPWIIRRCDNTSLDEVDRLETVYSYLDDRDG